MPTTTDRLGPKGNNPPALDALLKEKHKTIFDRVKSWKRKAAGADLSPKTIEDCAKLEQLFAEGRDIANDGDRVRTKEKEPSLQEGKIIDGLFNGEVRDAVGVKGGLAQKILDAAAARRLAITRAEQARLAEQAAATQREADKVEEQRKAREERGDTRGADVAAAKVDGLDRAAGDLSARASAPVEEASRGVTAGGRNVSVGAKLVCTGVVRDELDLNALRGYFKQEHLIDAVNAGIKIGAFTALKGAAIIEQAVGRVR